MSKYFKYLILFSFLILILFSITYLFVKYRGGVTFVGLGKLNKDVNLEDVEVFHDNVRKVFDLSNVDKKLEIQGIGLKLYGEIPSKDKLKIYQSLDKENKDDLSFGCSWDNQGQSSLASIDIYLDVEDYKKLLTTEEANRLLNKSVSLCIHRMVNEDISDASEAGRLRDEFYKKLDEANLTLVNFK